MAPVPLSEMLDELAVDVMDLQSQMVDEGNKAKHKPMIRKMIDKNFTAQKYQPIPEFDNGLDWFNCLEPLTFKQHLLGSIVVIDFWTYCCINCLHILPQLKRIEKKFPDSLAVVGCHSAKFTNEKSSENVKAAILRHDISHPVVNDLNNGMWNKLNIQCWPTMLFIDPQGRPFYLVMGEGRIEEIEQVLSIAIEYFRDVKQLSPRTIPLKPFALPSNPFELKFPSKIQCSNYDSNDTSEPLYALADSGNHRIIIFNSVGTVLHQIGQCGVAGFEDGSFTEAKFNSPNGVAFLDQKTVFVADTENNLIRMIMLEQRKVQTIIGDRQQGTDFNGGQTPLKQSISSPWDLVVYKTKNLDMSFHENEEQVLQKIVLIIAMAGLHQIWGYFMEEIIWWRYQVQNANTAVSIAGNGEERNRNNDYPKQASFAQPSGLCLLRNAHEIFIADSESSSIRKMSLASGKVAAVVGGANNPMNLFAYGDVDGERYTARLQHPLGVTHHPSEHFVFVADTFNNKIKKINVQTNNIQTLRIIDDESNEIMKFKEPADLCLTPDASQLLVINTNNHEIIKVNMSTMRASRFHLKWPAQKITNESIALPQGIPVVIVPNGRVFKRGISSFSLAIALNLHEGVKLTPDAPQKISPFLSRGWRLDYFDSEKLLFEGKTNVNVKIPPGTQEGDVTLHFVLLLCDEKDSSCFRKEFGVKVALKFINTNDITEPVFIGVTKSEILIR